MILVARRGQRRSLTKTFKVLSVAIARSPRARIFAWARLTAFCLRDRFRPETTPFGRCPHADAGARGRAEALRKGMGERGWDGDPVDVVQTPEGLTTIDNTRVAVAQELGLPERLADSVDTTSPRGPHTPGTVPGPRCSADLQLVR